jgi:hypothetical protein
MLGMQKKWLQQQQNQAGSFTMLKIGYMPRQ